MWASMPLFARALDRGRDERGHDQRGDPRHRQEPVSASLRLWGLGGEMADRDSEHLLVRKKEMLFRLLWRT